jgi:hypothetical protein
MKHDSNIHQAYTSKEIRDWIRRYRASGIGLGGFAERHGLPSTRLHCWVYDKRTSHLGKPVTAAPIFQEVKLAAGLPLQNWAVEISLPSGPVARFNLGFGGTVGENLT